MATPTSRLLLFSRSTAAISSSSSSSSSSLLLRRPFSCSLPSSSDSKPQPSIWSMLSKPSSSTSSTSSSSSSKIQTNLNFGGSLFNPSSSSSSSSSTPPPPSSGTIKTTAPGGSPYDKEASLWLDGPSAKAQADLDSALHQSASQGPYSSSSPFYNPQFNLAPFSTSPTPLPQQALDTLALVAASSPPPPPPPPPSSFSAYVSPFADSKSYNPLRQTLPRLFSEPTDDPELRWVQLSQEFKVLHKRKVPDQFTGRTFNFAPGNVGKMLNKFNGLIARSNMRVEERRKMRFERNPDKEWRLRRQRHMRRFAVAMRRNVQIVHGLRQRDQSPVL